MRVHAMRQQLEAALGDCTCAGAARLATSSLFVLLLSLTRGTAGAPHVVVL
jgi:hypothetical protein